MRFLSFAGLLLGATNASAALCTSAAGAVNWNAVGTWSCGHVPLNNDDVVVANNSVVTVNMAGAVAGSLTIAGGANTSTLQFGVAGTSLTVTNAGGLTGDVTINAPTSNGVFKRITVGARSLIVTGNVTINGGTAGGTAATRTSELTVTSGTVTIGTVGTPKTLSINAGTATTNIAQVVLTPAAGVGTITVNGNVTLTGGATAATQDALLNVNGASNAGTGVIITGSLSVNSTIAGSSSVTMTGAAGGRITVNGAGGVNNEDTLTVAAGIFSVTNAAATLTTSDPAIVSVTSVTSGTLAITGSAVVDSGAVGASSMTVTSGIITVGGTLGVTAAAAGASATGDATVSVTTGRISVTGNTTVTGGVVAGQVATLTVGGAGAVGQGVNIGGALNIVSTVAGTATVSAAATATSRITVTGAVNNEDTLTVGAGIVSVGTTLTTSDLAIAATTSVTTGTLTVAGNAVVDSGGNGLKTLTVGNGVISIGGSLSVTAAAATVDTGDATASVTGTGRITVTGGVTVTGGSNLNRDALLSVSGASAAGQGVNIGGALNIVSSVAGSSTVQASTGANVGRITVTGAVNNEDTLTVGAGIVSVGTTLTTSDPAIVSVTSVTSGTLAITGSAVVDSGAVGASSMTVTSGVITVGGTLGVTAAAAGASATGDATVSVTTGRISVTGNTTVTGGVVAGQVAALTVGGAPAVAGNGINIGGNLNVNATVATSSTVSITAVGGVINVAGDVNNQDTIAVGTGIFSATGAAATFTTTNTSGLAATTSVTSGTLAISGNAVVNSGTNGLKTMSVTTGVITVGGNLSVTAAAATNNGGDATVSVTTGRITVTGNATVTGGSNLNRDALLTVTAGGAVGQGINIGGTLGIVSTAAGSATVSTTNATGRITVSGAGGVNNGDTLAVGVGIVSLANAAATLTNSNAGIVATTTVSTGTLGIAGAVNNAAGETLVCSAACNISVGTSFTSNGTFTPSSGTVTLNGAAAQTISGTNPVPFNNLTVTNAADPNITLATNVTVSGTLTGTVTLTNTCPTDYTLMSTIPVQVLHSCPAAPASFNACSTTDACPTGTARLYTRIANRNFAVYLAALKADGTVQTVFNGSAAVSLVGRIASGGATGVDNCPTGAVDLTQALGTLAFTAGKRTQTGVNVANAYRDVRVKFVCDSTNCPPSGVTACSSDNFAVRPDNLAVSATISSPLKAGDATLGDTFTLSALASGNATTTTTYNGTPQVDAALLAAASSGPNIAGVLDGTFGAAAGGTASGTFGYSEVGWFNIAAQGVFDVAFATAADASGTDCTDDFDNTYTAADPTSTVGCRFGNQAASADIGRFTPDMFVSLSDGVPVPPVPSVTPFCGSGATGFTYAGQAALRLKVTLEAQNKAGIRTQNYDASYANGNGLVEFLAENADNDTNLGGRLDHAGGSWSLGRVVADTTGTFSRNNSTPDGPFDSLEIGVRVTRASTADGDDDGIKVSPEDMAVAGRNGLKLPGTTRVRHGILRLDNAYGSELLNLRVPMRTMYLATAPGQFIVNTLDSCTTLAAANVAFGNFKGSLASLTVNGINQVSAGQGSIVLTKPSLVGSADMAVNLTNTATDVSCNTTHPATTGANRAWLQGKWCGSNYDKDPNARVRFGASKAPYIYLRERY